MRLKRGNRASSRRSSRKLDSKTVTKNDLTPYIYPNEKIINNSEIKIMYFGYFFKWSMFENFNYIKKNVLILI